MSSAALYSYLCGPLLGIEGLCRLVVGFAREFEAELNTQCVVLKSYRAMVELPDDRLAISVVDKIFIVDVRTGQTLHTLPDNAFSMVVCGDTFATGSFRKTMRTWDVSTGVCTSTRHIEGVLFDIMPGYGAYNLCALPNFKMALYAFVDSQVRVWDMATGICLYTIQTQNKKRVLRAAALPDGKLVLAVEHILYVYDDGKFAFKRRAPTKKYVSQLRVSGQYLVSSSQDDTVHVWDTKTMTLIFTFVDVMHDHMAMLPEGKIALVPVSNNQQVKIHDLQGALLNTIQRSSAVKDLLPLSGDRLLTTHVNGDLCTWS